MLKRGAVILLHPFRLRANPPLSFVTIAQKVKTKKLVN